MTLVRFDPFRDLSVLQNRVNRLFTDSRAIATGRAASVDTTTRCWAQVPLSMTAAGVSP